MRTRALTMSLVLFVFVVAVDRAVSYGDHHGHHGDLEDNALFSDHEWHADGDDHHFDEGEHRKEGIGKDKVKLMTTATISATVTGTDSHSHNHAHSINHMTEHHSHSHSDDHHDEAHSDASDEHGFDDEEDGHGW
ncbi:Uncharacterized protein PBTT_08734 [Plasmodiophora brassicae]|uniref:Uncharacterized protein n=1 Tax=Plasmodiophora brassicae TaxID=37360 RepID=A0A0G4INC3_PLABS|nr:hypothetical protein PBRA_005417 [Plasmodiophora brassicae]SPR00644.1 unnamed protein product [Plasmodiophora brassicae]